MTQAYYRLKKELVELEARRDAVTDFIARNPTFYQVGLLVRQRNVMDEYLSILNERLREWRDNDVSKR